LIIKKPSTLSKRHSVHIFDDECDGLDASQCPVELPIKEIDGCSPIALSTLGVALARIAANKQLSRREFIVFGNIAALNFP
jgi:hypothetical protein